MKYTNEDLSLIVHNIDELQNKLNPNEIFIVDSELEHIVGSIGSELWVKLKVYFDDNDDTYSIRVMDFLNYENNKDNIKYRNASIIAFDVEKLNMYGSLRGLLDAELNYYREHNKSRHKTLEEKLTEIMEGK